MAFELGFNVSSKVCEAGEGFHYARLYLRQRLPRRLELGTEPLEASRPEEVFSRLLKYYPESVLQVAAAQVIRLCCGQAPPSEATHQNPRAELLGTYVFTKDEPHMYEDGIVGAPNDRDRVIVTFPNEHMALNGETILPPAASGRASLLPVRRVVQATWDPINTRTHVALRGNEIMIQPSIVGMPVPPGARQARR